MIGHVRLGCASFKWVCAPSLPAQTVIAMTSVQVIAPRAKGMPPLLTATFSMFVFNHLRRVGRTATTSPSRTDVGKSIRAVNWVDGRYRCRDFRRQRFAPLGG